MIYEYRKEKKQADLNLYICGKDENLTPGIVYGPVIRDIYIIECTTGGYGSVIINGTEFPVKRGDCIILKPGDTIIHTADFKYPREGVWCGVNGMKISSYCAQANITSQMPYAPPESFNGILHYIKKMLDVDSDKDPGAELRKNALIHMLFSELLRHTTGSEYKDTYIQKAISIMEVNYAKDLNVAYLASELGLDRCYFSTLFKNKTGKSPHLFLNELRIKKACMLMESENLTISEIAQAVGIEAINFSRIFKKFTGMLPTEYKKNL